MSCNWSKKIGTKFLGFLLLMFGLLKIYVNLISLLFSLLSCACLSCGIDDNIKAILITDTVVCSLYIITNILLLGALFKDNNPLELLFWLLVTIVWSIFTRYVYIVLNAMVQDICNHKLPLLSSELIIFPASFCFWLVIFMRYIELKSQKHRYTKNSANDQPTGIPNSATKLKWRPKNNVHIV